MIQGHLQCQKVKLNLLKVTKYNDIIVTYTNGKKMFLFDFECRMHVCDFLTNTLISITSIIRCTSDKQIESAWSSSSQPVFSVLKLVSHNLADYFRPLIISYFQK